MLTSPPRSLKGALRPRVESRPATITGSFGDVAAELMARAGKPLESWQADAVDLMLSYRADGMWACYEYAEWVARQNGKGAIGEARALTGFFVLGEELITWTAHEYKTAHEAFRRMKALIRRLGKSLSDTLVDCDGVLIKISNGNEESFERLDTGQRIIFIARSKSSGRGFTGDVVIIDETFAYTSEQAEALGPTLIARPNAQIVYLSSPPLTGESGEIMYGLKERADKGGDDSLGYRDWGIAGDLDDRARMDLDDLERWAQANPALGRGRVTVETITRLRRMLSAQDARGFAREVLGLWPRHHEGGGDIDPAAWRQMEDPESRREGDITIGVDLNPTQDAAAIGLFGLRADGRDHLQLMDCRPGIDWVPGRLVELEEILKPVGYAMGRNTYAALEAELLKLGFKRPEKADEPERGDIAVVQGADMSAATGLMLAVCRPVPGDDGVLDYRARHIGQKELTTAALSAKVREGGDSVGWSRKDSGGDITPMNSVTVAKWLFQAWAHLINNDYDLMDSVL